MGGESEALRTLLPDGGFAWFGVPVMCEWNLPLTLPLTQTHKQATDWPWSKQTLVCICVLTDITYGNQVHALIVTVCALMSF